MTKASISHAKVADIPIEKIKSLYSKVQMVQYIQAIYHCLIQCNQENNGQTYWQTLHIPTPTIHAFNHIWHILTAYWIIAIHQLINQHGKSDELSLQLFSTLYHSEAPFPASFKKYQSQLKTLRDANAHVFFQEKFTINYQNHKQIAFSVLDELSTDITNYFIHGCNLCSNNDIKSIAKDCANLNYDIIIRNAFIGFPQLEQSITTNGQPKLIRPFDQQEV